MKKLQEKEALRLSQECLYHFWQLDVDYFLGFCDENVSWIGSEQKEFIQGFENVEQNCTEMLNFLRPCHLVHQEFFIAQSCGKTCTVIGKYLVTTDDENDYFLQVQQRCTFVWELKDDKFKIMHLHISNPMGELKIAEGERFVNSLGYMANKYLEKKFEEKFPSRQIFVTDESGTTCLVHMSEILYVTAHHNDLIITAANDVIHAKLSMNEFMKLAGKEFLRVHRSYTINMSYMSKLERYVITMTNGDKIPVPVKKYNQIKEEIAKIHNGR